MLLLAHFLELCILLGFCNGYINHCFFKIIKITQKEIKMSFDFKRMLKFEHNVGEKEKKYRMYAGAALIAISIFTASIALLLIGMVLVGTGFSGWCPAYSGLNKNSCGADNNATNN
jgi:hypothetical protein